MGNKWWHRRGWGGNSPFRKRKRDGSPSSPPSPSEVDGQAMAPAGKPPVPPAVCTGDAVNAGAAGSTSNGAAAVASTWQGRQESSGRRPSSPQAMSQDGREWQAWLRELQHDINLLRKLDPDELFSAKANELRTRVAAHIIQLKTHVDDRVADGLRLVHEEVQELAERAGFHYRFFSWAYLSRLAVAIVLFMVAAYICAVASQVTGWRTPHMVILDLDMRPTSQHTLPDLGHDLTSYLLAKLGFTNDYINIFHIPDTIVTWLSTFTLLFVLSHPRRFLIIRRALIIFAILFLFRSVTVTVTSLPDASPKCLAQFYDPNVHYKREPIFPRAFIRAFKFMTDPSSTVTCGDMIFSGHTTILMMCSMIFKKYCRGKMLQSKVFFRSFHISELQCIIIRRLVYLITFVGAMLIIGTRFHYTLDVLWALYLTQRVFKFYMDAVKYPNLLRDTPMSSLLRWMETEEILSIEQTAFDIVRKKT